MMRAITPLILLVLIFSCNTDMIVDSRYYSCKSIIPENTVHSDDIQRYQRLLDDITRSGVPGIMMSIRMGGLHWSGAAGKADLASDISLQSCNITRVGSTVKTFTAVTILLLAEEEKLSLDDPITKYLSLGLLKNIQNADRATIRQLLQHASGIYNYIQSPRFQTASLNDLTKVWSRDELLAYARGLDANFAIGSDVLYSNTNYILLGEIINSIEGKPFYKVFEERIFNPLNMMFTTFAAEDPVPSGIIQGYVDLYSKLHVINTTDYNGWDYYTADGGLISNAHDLNRFMKALFNGDILSEKSLSEMIKWQEPQEQPDNEFRIHYGLGIFKIDTPYGSAYMHSGDAIGYYACMIYFPDHGVTISWAVNGNYGAIDQYSQTKKAMEKIFDTVLK